MKTPSKEVASEDPVILLPETPLHLQPHLRAVAVAAFVHGIGHGGREVDVDPLQHGHRQAAHTVVPDLLVFPSGSRVPVDHADGVLGLVDGPYFGLHGDLVADGSLEGKRDLLHATYGLKHGMWSAGAGVQRPDLSCESGVEQRAQIVSVLIPGTAQPGWPVHELVGIQVAGSDQKPDQELLVFLGKWCVDLALLHRLGEQLRGGSPEVCLDLPQAHSPAGQRSPFGVFFPHVVRVAPVHEQLQRNTELLAITEHSLVVVRNPPGAGVQVLPFVEVAHLVFAPDLRVLRPAPDRPTEATHPLAGFQDVVVVAQLPQLVPHREPRHAGAQHDHLRVRRPALQLRSRARDAHQATRAHGSHHQG